MFCLDTAVFEGSVTDECDRTLDTTLFGSISTIILPIGGLALDGPNEMLKRELG